MSFPPVRLTLRRLLILSAVFLASVVLLRQSEIASRAEMVLDSSRVVMGDVTIDTSLPLQFTFPAEGAIVRSGKIFVRGKTEPDRVVVLKEDFDTFLGEAQADAAGNFVFKPDTAFEDGRHAITATTQDPAGNVAAAVLTFHIGASKFLDGWFVSAEFGSDTNDGDTTESPFRTIHRALEVMQSGDNVYLMPGVHVMETFVIRPDQGGSPFKKTVIAALPGAEGQVHVYVPGGGWFYSEAVDANVFSSGGFQIRNVNYLEIRGIHFSGNGVGRIGLLEGMEYVDLVNNRFSNSNTGLLFNVSENFRVFNNTFEDFTHEAARFMGAIDNFVFSSNTVVSSHRTIVEDVPGRVGQAFYTYNNFEDIYVPSFPSSPDTAVFDNFERLMDGSVREGPGWRRTPNDTALVMDTVDLNGDEEVDNGRTSFFNSAFDAFDPFKGEPPALPPPFAWYVSPDGSDVSPGNSTALPFKTIERAFKVAGSADTIYLMPGLYTPAQFSVPETLSGTFGNPATLRVLPGAEGRVRIKSPPQGFIFKNLHDVTVMGIVFEGHNVAEQLVNVVQSRRIHFINNRFLGDTFPYTGLGIDLGEHYKSFGVLVYNNLFQNFAVRGVYLNGAVGIKVVGNVIRNSRYPVARGTDAGEAVGSIAAFNDFEDVHADGFGDFPSSAFVENYARPRFGQVFNPLWPVANRPEFNDTVPVLHDIDLDGDGVIDNGQTAFYVGPFDTNPPFVNQFPLVRNIVKCGIHSFPFVLRLPASFEWEYSDPDISHQRTAHIQISQDISFVQPAVDEVVPLSDIFSSSIPASLRDISPGPWFLRMRVNDGADFGPFSAASDSFVVFRAVPAPLFDPIPVAFPAAVSSVTLSGRAPHPAARVKIFRGLEQVGDVSVESERFSLSGVVLNAGGNEFVAVAGDEFSIESEPSVSVYTTVDGQALLRLDTIPSITRQSSLIVSGTADAGAEVAVELNGLPQAVSLIPGTSPIFIDVTPPPGLVNFRTGMQFGSQILFEETFDETSPFVPVSGTWSVRDCALSETAEAGEHHSFLPDRIFTDFVYEGTIIFDMPLVAPGADQQGWILFRTQDNGGLYGFGFRNADGPAKFELWQRSGFFMELAEFVPTFPVIEGVPIRLKVVARGDRIRCKAWPESEPEPAQFQIDVRSTLFAAGGIGLRTHNVAASFDSLQVRTINEDLSVEIPFEVPSADLTRMTARPTGLARDGSVEVVSFLPSMAENFDDGRADDFTEVSSSWSFQQGGYVLSSIGASNWMAFSRTNRAFGDFDMEVDVNPLGGSFLGVNFRIDASGQNFYTVYLRFGADVALEYTQNGVRQTNALGLSPHVINTSRAYPLRVRTDGPRIRVWLDGELKFDVTDGHFAQGHIGLTAFPGTVALFDNFKVAEKVVVEDQTVIDVSGLETVSIGVVLTRPTVETPGPFFEHLLVESLAAFSGETIQLAPGLNTLTARVTDARGNAAETTVQIILDQTPPDITNLKTEPGQFTALTGFTEISFTAADNFPQFDGFMSAVVRDQTGRIVAPLASDSLVEYGPVSLVWDGNVTPTVESEDFDDGTAEHFVPHAGTWSFSQGGYVLNAGGIGNWRAFSRTDRTYGDFDLEVDINALSDKFPGVNFRMDQAANNFYTVYYRVGDGDIALEHTQNGSRQTNSFGVAPQTIVNNRVYRLRIKAEGSRIQIWVDGILKFDITDGRYSNGYIGLTAFSGTQALFDNFRLLTGRPGPAPDGTYSVEVSIRDAAGNESSDSVGVVVTSDFIPPFFTRFSPPGGETFVAKRDTIVISVAAADNKDPFPAVFAQMAHFVGSVSDTAMTVGDSQQIAPHSIPAGQWKLVATAHDASGNVRTQEGGFFSVVHDGLPPRTTLSVGDLKYVRQTDTATYITPLTPLTFSAVDDMATLNDGQGLGVAKIEAGVDNGAFVTVASPVTLTDFGAASEGRHAVSYRATDVTGNVEATRLSILYIDATAPVTTTTPSPQANNNGWNAVDVDISLAANDPALSDGSTMGSGMKETRLGVDGYAPAVYTGAATISIEGLHGFDFFGVDNIGNTEAVKSNTVRIDKTIPAVNVNRAPPANNNNWNRDPVFVSYTATDTLSGIDTSLSDLATDVLAKEDAGQSISASAVDLAGNTTTVTVTNINIDSTSPVVTTAKTPLPNLNGWNNTSVSVTFAETDALSGIDTPANDVTFASEGFSQSATGVSVDLAGNTTTVTVSGINLDLTNPVVAGTANPSANLHGWRNTPVSVSFDETDVLSGIDTPGVDVTLTNEGVGRTASGFAVDISGNTGTAMVANINIDFTRPVMTSSRVPVANPNGWNNSTVTVSYTATDTLSGLDEALTDTNTDVLSTEGPGQTVDANAVDKAGNNSTVSVTDINIDLTVPMVTASRAPDANVHGWNNTAVTVTYTAIDALSGVDTANGDVATDVLNTEGAGQSTSGFVVDLAGNTGASTISNINIDFIAPAIALQSVTPDSSGLGSDGLSWWKSPVNVTFTASDALSGLAITQLLFTLPNEGKDQGVTGIAVDKADNTSTLTTGGINVDFTTPNVSLSVGTPQIVDGQTYIKSTTELTVNATDAISGMKAITVSTTPSGFFAVSSNMAEVVSGTLITEGQIVLAFSGTDVATNNSAVQTATFIVDNTAPATTLIVDITDTTGTVLIPQSEITLTAVDGPILTPAVGVGRIEYTIDGGPAQIYTSPFSVSGVGHHTLTYHAFDRLGNSEAPQTFGFTVSPALSAAKFVSFAPRVLVWLNDGKDKDDDDDEDEDGDKKDIPAENLAVLKSILVSAPILLFDMVERSDSFVALMRTDSYNVYLIIGDEEHLDKEQEWELSERVRMGDGLISSFMDEIEMPVKDKGEHEDKDEDDGKGKDKDEDKDDDGDDKGKGKDKSEDDDKHGYHDENEHGGDDGDGGGDEHDGHDKDNKAAKNLLGVDVDGNHSDKDMAITLTGAGVDYSGDYRTEGKTKRVRALAATAAADGFVTPNGKDKDPEPSVVSNSFGDGKTVFFAFDVGLSAEPSNAAPTEQLLNAALRKVTPIREVLVPDGRVAVGIAVQSNVVPLDLAVRIEEVLPAGASVVNGLGGDVQGNVVVWNMALDAGYADTVHYVLGIPDEGEADVTTNADVSYLVRGNYVTFATLPLTLVAEQDLPNLLDLAVAQLNALAVNGNDDGNKVEDAVEELQKQRNTPPTTDKNIVDDIKDVLEIVRDVSGLDAEPHAVSDLRDALDKIILIYERMYSR